MTSDPSLFGLMAEFETAQDVLQATQRAWQAGYRRMDAYTPYPVEGLAQVLGHRKTVIPSVVLVAGLVGGAIGFFMQYWSMAVDYRFNSGGRPYNSWPVFIPVTFELLILVGSLAAFLSVLFLNGLPRPNHPLFNVPEFARASQDRFFLCIEAADAHFEMEKTSAFLAGLAFGGVVLEVPIQLRPSAPEPESPRKEAIPV
jgi:hypothetical protein